MKEATGELSTTVITIVAIAAIAAIFTAFLLPTLRAQIALSQACAGGPGYTTKDTTGASKSYVECGNAKRGESYTCTYYNDGKSGGTKTCRFD